MKIAKYLLGASLLLPAFAQAYEEETPLGTWQSFERFGQEMRARERASYDNLLARAGARIEKSFGLPAGALSVRLTDNYGSYSSVYVFTSPDGRVECAMISFRAGEFSVSCNGKAMFRIRR